MARNTALATIPQLERMMRNLETEVNDGQRDVRREFETLKAESRRELASLRFELRGFLVTIFLFIFIFITFQAYSSGADTPPKTPGEIVEETIFPKGDGPWNKPEEPVDESSPEVIARRIVEKAVREDLEDNLVDLDDLGPFPGGDIQYTDEEGLFDLDIALKEIKPTASVATINVTSVRIRPESSSVDIELLHQKPLIISGLCRITRGKSPFGDFDGSGSCSFKILKLRLFLTANFTSGLRSYPRISDLQIRYTFTDFNVLKFDTLTISGEKEVNQVMFSMAAKYLNGWAYERVQKFAQPIVRDFLDGIFKYVPDFYDTVAVQARPDEL